MSVFNATSFELGLCDDPTCKALHIMLKDEREITRAQMTIAVEHISDVTKRMVDFAYEIVTTKGPLK